MKKITFSMLLVALLFSGCATTPVPNPPPDLSYIEELGNTIILEIEFETVTAQTAIDTLRAEWKAQKGTELPLTELTDMDVRIHPRERTITYQASNICYREALRAIATKSGYCISFREDQIVLSNIFPKEHMSFNWKLDDKTKSSLGLSADPTSEDIQNALEKRGADFSNEAMSIYLLKESGAVLFTGATENISTAKAILMLISNGYEINKKAVESL